MFIHFQNRAKKQATIAQALANSTPRSIGFILIFISSFLSPFVQWKQTFMWRFWFAEKGISFAAANSKWFKAIFQRVDAHPPSPAKIQEHVRIAEVISCLSMQHITNHP